MSTKNLQKEIHPGVPLFSRRKDPGWRFSKFGWTFNYDWCPSIDVIEHFGVKLQPAQK